MEGKRQRRRVPLPSCRNCAASLKKPHLTTIQNKLEVKYVVVKCYLNNTFVYKFLLNLHPILFPLKFYFMICVFRNLLMKSLYLQKSY